jgi:diguanylate cyclase (GGDEF)-like protein
MKKGAAVLKVRLSPLGKIHHAARGIRTSAAAAMLLILGVILTGVVLDRQHTESYRQELRGRTEKAATFLSGRLAARLDKDVWLAKHLAQAFTGEAGGSASRFRHVAEEEIAGTPHFLAIALAPNSELADVFTRQSLGLDAHDLEVDAGLLGEQVNSVRQDGPAKLLSDARNGHLTLVLPFGEPAAGTTGHGSIAVAIDQAGLMEASGISFAPTGSGSGALADLSWMDVAIRDMGREGGPVIFGDASIPAPRAWPLAVNGATWEILAAPKAGWNAVPPDQTIIRLSIALAALGMIVPIIVASLLIDERNRNIAALKAREANLLQLSQRFHLAMESSNIGIWEVTDDHRLYWDERAAALHGRQAEARGSRLEDWLASIFPEDRAAAEAHFFIATCSMSPCSDIYRVRLEDGALRYLRSAGASYLNADGSRRTTGIVWDITADMVMTETLRAAKETSDIKNAELELALDELSNREQELEELSTKLDLALEASNCGIWESDPATHFETWDARMCQLHGIPFTDGRITADQWIELLHPDDRALAHNSSFHFREEFRSEMLVARVLLPDGSVRYIRSIGKLRTGRDGTQKVIGIAFDVTADAVLAEELRAAKEEADAKNAELELAKSRIEHNALHDPLTELANRRKLDLELDRLSRASQGERQKFSILHLDLDRFKQINDTLGHAAGDAMLVHAARVLSRNVGSGDLVARIGGDEFVIFVNGNCSAEQMADLAAGIITELRQPIDFEGFSCRGGVSIGIAQASGFNLDARRTLVNADIALYRAKGMGRNRYEFFTQNLQAEIISHKRTADEVLAGIDNHEFVTWYQPQFDARSNELTGVEALVRWNHPHHGILAPDRFLKIAEDLNVAATLDQIVLETVLKDRMRWAALGIRIPKVSVNVSSRRLHDEGLIDSLKGLAIAPGQVSFELVESIFLDESEAAAASNLERIKALGIDIEIDDFGTGHTSIVSLLKLKPKRLKIDRQLVMPILTSPQERALVRSIIDIARSLGVETVAEGVETMQHASLLRELGCDLLQGYAFSRPLSFDDFTRSALAGWRKAAA